MAIRLTRQNYSIGIFDLSGKNVQLIREDICHGSNPQLILSSILANGLKLIKTTPNRKILLAGVAIPGPYNLKKDRIALMTGLDGWNEIDIKTQLENSFQIPVFVEQDANCGAIAQYWFTDTPPQDNSLIYIAVGQGIGAGIIYNGEIIHGSLGTAGEIGHASINFNGRKCACGNTGCLETYCSSIVFTDEVNDALHTDTRLSFNDVRALTKANNPIAIKIYKDMCSKLSIGITNLINSLNPSIIVLGDELCHVAPEIMLNEIKTNVGKRILPDIIESTTICTSFVGQNKDSVFHGAAVIAIKELFLNPQNYFI